MNNFILDGLKRKIPPNPTIELAEQILIEAKTAASITSIGGGSTIDIGKYIAWKLKISHTAIPTTAGTGSEVTKFAVFIKNGEKITFENNDLIPNNYELDASRILTLSPLHTLSSGLDALCQGIESYWSPRATNESRHYARLAFRTASKNLLSSYENPENEYLRMKMLYAANYSGRAINITRTSVCHAISYPLTIHYGIPHGIACAWTMPYFIDYFGFEFLKARQIVKILKKEKIYKNIDKDLIAREAMNYQGVKNTPKKVDYQTIKNSLWFIFQ
mgnify:CR=1 FL=1